MIQEKIILDLYSLCIFCFVFFFPPDIFIFNSSLLLLLQDLFPPWKEDHQQPTSPSSYHAKGKTPVFITTSLMMPLSNKFVVWLLTLSSTTFCRNNERGEKEGPFQSNELNSSVFLTLASSGLKAQAWSKIPPSSKNTFILFQIQAERIKNWSDRAQPSMLCIEGRGGLIGICDGKSQIWCLLTEFKYCVQN